MAVETILILIVSSIISLFILYFVIRKAIQDGTQPMLETMEVLCILKKEELRKEGFDSYSLLNTIDKEKALKKLDAKFKSGMITEDLYEQKKIEILSAS